MTAWRSFIPGPWTDGVNVRDFLQKNYTPYEGNSDFLVGPTERTRRLWKTLSSLLDEERKKGVLDVSADVPASITAHGPGYIDRGLETVVGLQTDAPLKRAIMPNGGLRMVETGLEAYGYHLGAGLHEIWTKYRKDHYSGPTRLDRDVSLSA